MIGLVIVSHSRALADAAVGLAAEMVPAEASPAMAVAAGLDETTFGTDAAAIAAAIERVDSPDGVLIMVDLGSAILSAEMALEFIDPDLAGRCHISAAPLVEGLIAAVVTAGTGASLDDVAREAEAGLAGKRAQLGLAETAATVAGPVVPLDTESASPSDALSFTTTIRNPHGLHARPAAALVAGLRGLDAQIQLRNATSGTGPVPATSLTMIQTLGLRHGDQLSAAVSGPQAAQAIAALTQLAADDFGEDVAPATAAGANPGPTNPAPVSPAPVSPLAPADPARTGQQIAIGPAVQISLSLDTSGYVAGDAATESARLDAAIATVQHQLDRLDAAAPDDIYQVQAMMLDDDDAQAALRSAIAQGQPAPQAVAEHFEAVADQLSTIADPYFQARAEDQRGLARWLIRALTQADADQAAGVFIVAELDPITAGGLDPQVCQGVITTQGGATGHGVIIAQARGFAILTGRPEAAAIPAGQVIAFDPTTGQLWTDPSPAELDELRQRDHDRQAAASAAAALSHSPALTPAGRHILVEANIGSLADALTGQQMGADGSGLVRTEVLFGDWTQAPTAEEQAELYIQIGQLLGGTITVRTWDPGGDKPLAFLPQTPEANPMLGERGLRAMRRLPELLDNQLEAILLAARQVPIRVMFPMVTLPSEVGWARQRLSIVQARLGGQVDVGMMVETPAAALTAADFTDLVDFVSIGSNDLTQYTMAVDRGNATVADLARSDADAVWRLIELTGRGFAGKPVAVCGDLASKPELTSRLIAAGVTELSVRPPLIGLVKQAVRAG